LYRDDQEVEEFTMLPRFSAIKYPEAAVCGYLSVSSD